jgi:long-chain acyl-CoA synthetase
MLLGDLPRKAAEVEPSETAVFFEGREITYGDVAVNTGRVANGLRKLGLRKGDRVAIMLPNIPEFIYSFFGIQRIGAVAVPFNTMYKGGEVSHILRDSGARAVIALANFAPLINEILPDLPDLEHVILTGERNVIFADPDATVFVQLVADRETFGEPDEAYRRIGEVLLATLTSLGVEDAWYKHRGSVRVGGKKLAGFLIQEVEELYVASILIFVEALRIEEFISVIWVPQEIKDKVMEPTVSVAEATGRRPAWEEIRDAVTQQFESAFGIRLAPGPLERDELFGYEKLRSLMARKDE